MVVVHHETIAMVVLLAARILLLRLLALLQQAILHLLYLQESILPLVRLLATVPLACPGATRQYQTGMTVVLGQDNWLVLGVKVAAKLHHAHLLVPVLHSLRHQQ